VSERREAHEAVVSGKKYKVLTDPRLRYMRPGLIIGAPYKESVVIGVDWSILLHSLKIAAKHDEVDTVDDDYFLVRNFGGKDYDVGDDYRRVVLKLLRTWPCFGEPLARKMLNRVANELERLWWPSATAEKQRRRLWEAQLLRKLLDIMTEENRQAGVSAPRAAAKEELAEWVGHASAEALRKALQPNRVNRRPRRNKRG
jgi:hypothetical protein